MTFHLMFVLIIFSSVYVAEWPLWGKIAQVPSHCFLVTFKTLLFVTNRSKAMVLPWLSLLFHIGVSCGAVFTVCVDIYLNTKFLQPFFVHFFFCTVQIRVLS